MSATPLDRAVVRSVTVAAALVIAALAIAALVKYPGNGATYLLFTIAANGLLWAGFRRGAIFFDTFIGAFFWIGFWLKLSVRVAFFGGTFNEQVGHFDGSGDAFDRGLLVASCGFMALLAASYLRARWLFRYDAPAQLPRSGLFEFYQRHRIACLVVFAAAFLLVGATNLHLGIYQRGEIPRTALPFGLNGVFTWLLLFGLASGSALILHFEFVRRQNTSYAATLLALVESLVSNVSMFSRGMILNSAALGYGLFRARVLNGIRVRWRFWVVAVVLLLVLMAASVLLVNYVRAVQQAPADDSVREAQRSTLTLLLDRWVGMEGVLAVSSYPRLGWELWHEALREAPAPKMSFYDERFITSSYVHSDFSRYRFISLPGLIAFLFYPGSFAFLFMAVFLLGLAAGVIEMATYKLGGHNVVLCALLAEVVASRYVHFGYVPKQSYLLLGALCLNILLIWLLDRTLLRLQARRG